MFYFIQLLSDWVTYSLLRLRPETLLAGAVNFFIFDTIKIFILLAIIIYIISFIRTYLPPEKSRAILSHKNELVGNILAAILGIFTPFCSCSAIPLFLGFVEAGVPLGITFSFLVSSPMINEIAVVLLLGLFGWKISLIYVISGLSIAITSGMIIGKMKVENLVADFVYKNRVNVGENANADKLDLKERHTYSYEYALDIIKRTWLWIVIGIGAGAWIHGYIPTSFLAQYAGADKWYAVPLASVIGIPLYANVAGIIPLIKVLSEKGVAMGTTLSFMMSVTALSLPQFLILKKVLKTKLIIIFASIVGLSIIFTGYLFNFILR